MTSYNEYNNKSVIPLGKVIYTDQTTVLTLGIGQISRDIVYHEIPLNQCPSWSTSPFLPTFSYNKTTL